MSLQEKKPKHFQEETDPDNLDFGICKAYEKIHSDPEVDFQAQKLQS